MSVKKLKTPRKFGGYAVSKSISMPVVMFVNAMEKGRQEGFSQFSDYVQNLIRRDGVTLVER